MRLERMMGILLRLLAAEQVTAKDLARTFEVSVRTIYRDIDALSAAGVPLYSQPGHKGGIRIMPGYTLPRSLLSMNEQSFLLHLLQDFASQSEEALSLEQKLSALFAQKESPEWLRVDLYHFGQGEADPRFLRCKEAIQSCRLLRFDYRNGNGEFSVRTVEPMTLLFRGGNCYLWAWCCLRNGYRQFRLSRMRREEILQERFLRREENFRDWESSQPSTQDYQLIELLFAANAENRVLNEFWEGDLERLADGRLLARVVWPMDQWVLQMLLSYGADVDILSPTCLRQAVQKEIIRAAEHLSRADDGISTISRKTGNGTIDTVFNKEEEV